MLKLTVLSESAVVSLRLVLLGWDVASDALALRVGILVLIYPLFGERWCWACISSMQLAVELQLKVCFRADSSEQAFVCWARVLASGASLTRRVHLYTGRLMRRSSVVAVGSVMKRVWS